MLFRIACLTAALLLAPGLAFGRVDLIASVQIEDDLVRLGDLFAGLAPQQAETPVAHAPEPGKSVQLDARWLARLAEAYAVDWRPSSRFDSTRLTRASFLVDKDWLHQALLTDPKIDASAREREFHLRLDTQVLPLALPAESAQGVRLAGLAYNPINGRFQARIVDTRDGAQRTWGQVSGQLVEMKQVPVMRSNLAPGEVVSQRDIHYVAMPGDRLAGNTIIEAGQILGLAARRGLRAGTPIRANDLQQPVMVKKNGLVLLRLDTPYMQLSTQGRALDDGAQGELVRVMNLRSKVIVQGTVDGDGLVRVAPAGHGMQPATR